MPQSLVGLRKAELDTPVLCLDRDRLERNIRTMIDTVHAGGKAWRPHAKGHKTPALAWREIDAGAAGITCAKLGEAEVFAAAGLHNILVANVIAGERKAERLAGLCRWSTPIICCDHYAQAEPIAAACRRLGVTCRVLVDINIGMNRTGIRPGKDAVELGQAIDRLDGLQLLGIMGYEGHLLKLADKDDKVRQIRESVGILEHCRDSFLKHGLRCDIVSAGGTGSVAITSHCPAVTELQAGGGVFGDPMYVNLCGLDGVEPAVTVLATVVSRPTLERAVLDAGRKTTNPDVHPPSVKGYPDAVIQSLSAEHCTLQLGPESQTLRIGDQVELIVGYSDFTTLLHEEFYVFHGDRLEAIWPIWARGRLQ
ncbi:MAG: DSD1 family PLP-dependent enzyme [Planctomycetaceae bacterium]|nr:DSD1 family PLP-dependent enzyme [Planctomycetaceae bacterium]